MPVVTQQGLVGKIDAVTASARAIQLITDPGSVVNVRLQNQMADAQITGSVTGEVTLEMLSQNTNAYPREKSY